MEKSMVSYLPEWQVLCKR